MIADHIVLQPGARFGRRILNNQFADRRVLIGALVIVAHLLLAWTIAFQFDSPRPLISSIGRMQLLGSRTTSVHPILTVSAPASLERLEVSKWESTLPAQLTYETMPNQLANAALSGNVIPPHLAEFNSSDTPQSNVTGMADGAEATVVLRIEVKADGSLGRVQVDVSGGSKQIDEAAIVHARSLSWLGGSIDNQPATLWIRWAVRLHT